MSDYYKLFDYCVKIHTQNIKRKESIQKHKEAKEKRKLFNTIITNAYTKIKNSVDDGKDYAIIYDDEYNKLIVELKETLNTHFKPFNIIYKKKLYYNRGFLEVIKDESNYILIVDWNKKSNNTEITVNLNNNESNIGLNNSESHINLNNTETNVNSNNSEFNISLNNTKTNVSSNIETTVNLNSTESNIKEKETDSFLNHLGFESIF